MIVHNICKIIGRISIGLDQDHIVQFCIINGNISVDLILECRCALCRVILTDDIRNSSRKLFLYFFLGQMQAVLVINRNLFACYRLL